MYQRRQLYPLAAALTAMVVLAGCGHESGRILSPEGTAVRAAVDSTNAVNRATFAFPGGDWSPRVAWEARYALSNQANGTSRWPISADGYGPRWLADWCYTNNVSGEGNDPYALGKAKEEAFGFVGTIGHNPATSHHYSGWCTFFVRLVLYRATYWAGYGSHLTMPNFGQGSMYDWCNTKYMTKDFASARPGWLALKPPPEEHIGVLDQRATVNGRDGWWMIDGNYVGSMLTGRHFMPVSKLQAECWAWRPTLATSN